MRKHVQLNSMHILVRDASLSSKTCLIEADHLLDMSVFNTIKRPWNNYLSKPKKHMQIHLRNETTSDHRVVEEITRKAFWNLHTPGCDDHYLVHTMREHADFVAALDYVAEVNGQLVGNIMYTKSYLLDEAGKQHDTLTFGPVSVLPEWQRKGIGSRLIEASMAAAKHSGCTTIVIYGNPGDYCRYGFKSCKTFNVATPEGKYPCSLLVKELEEGALSEHSWRFFESDVYDLDYAGFEAYDATFEVAQKEYKPSQELFSILCSAFIED